MKYNYVISAQGNSVDENIRSALREIGLKKIFVEKIPDVQSILVDQNNSVNENILKICHDFCGFDYSDNIIDAFKECGISAKILSADREISL